MSVTLTPELEAFAEDQVRRRGLPDVEEYVNQLVRSEKQRQAAPEQPGRGRAWIERIRGTATSGLTTDQIMEMTRSEV